MAELDWAERAAVMAFSPVQYHDEDLQAYVDRNRARVVAALRKAKADGLREAAELVWNYGNGNPHQLKRAILNAADEIEKGEPI